MEILLKTNIEQLGRIGDVVTVKAGYARNFLLPTGQAIMVNKANMEEIEVERKKAQLEEIARIGDLKSLRDQLSGTSITIEGRANDEGHLFGSVTAAQIALALKEKSLPVEEKQVRLEAPLKEIGVFDVSVHLHAEVESTVKVWVVQAKPT